MSPFLNDTVPDVCHGDDFSLSRVLFKHGKMPHIFLVHWGECLVRATLFLHGARGVKVAM